MNQDQFEINSELIINKNNSDIEQVIVFELTVIFIYYYISLKILFINIFLSSPIILKIILINIYISLIYL